MFVLKSSCIHHGTGYLAKTSKGRAQWRQDRQHPWSRPNISSDATKEDDQQGLLAKGEARSIIPDSISSAPLVSAVGS